MSAIVRIVVWTGRSAGAAIIIMVNMNASNNNNYPSKTSNNIRYPCNAVNNSCYPSNAINNSYYPCKTSNDSCYPTNVSQQRAKVKQRCGRGCGCVWGEVEKVDEHVPPRASVRGRREWGLAG